MRNNVVYITANGKVNRWGYTDWENDGNFNAGTESVVIVDRKFNRKFGYTYNSGTGIFTRGSALIVANYTLTELIDFGKLITPEMVKRKVRQDSATDAQRRRIRNAIKDGFNENIMDKDWTQARATIADYQSAGDMIQADYDLIDGILPS